MKLEIYVSAVITVMFWLGFFLALFTAHPCYKLANLTKDQIYATVASTTAVWFEGKNGMEVLPLCEGYYSQQQQRYLYSI